MFREPHNGVTEQAPPVLLQEPPQLSVPVVVLSQAGVGAEHEPFGTQTADPGVTVKSLVSLSQVRR